MFVTKLFGLLKDKAVDILDAVSEISIPTVIKVGLGVGAAVVATVVVGKIVKDKIESYRTTEYKDPIDNINETNNFKDARKQRSLHKGMRRVRRNLNRDSRKKKKEKYGWIKMLIAEEEKRMKAQRDKFVKEGDYFDDRYRYAFRCFDYDGWEEIDENERLKDFFEYYFTYNPDGSKEGPDRGYLRRVWDDSVSHY